MEEGKEIKDSELPKGLKPKYVYPNVKIIEFRANHKDIEMIEDIKKRIISGKTKVGSERKKTNSMVIRKSLEYAFDYMPKVV